MNPIQLGASLYVPATRRDLVEIANGRKKFTLRSVIFCTEDSVSEEDLPYALDRLSESLPDFQANHQLRFIRVRNPDVFQKILTMDGIEAVDGFVLPKVEVDVLEDYLGCLPRDHSFHWMMTLETAQVFELDRLVALRERLMAIRNQVLTLRIGGNDLLNLLSLRRMPGRLIYETPLCHTIAQLVTLFRSRGFNLTSPVYDYIHDEETLVRETRMDLEYGLFGKTAIHPSQVEVIERCYRVVPQDLAMAEAILSESAPAVFRVNNAMCEPATHRQWAERIVLRAEYYGVATEIEVERESMGAIRFSNYAW